MKIISFTLAFLLIISGTAIADAEFLTPLALTDLHGNSTHLISNPQWSRDASYMLFSSIDATTIHNQKKWHYLVDIENRTYGEIDYGINEIDRGFIGTASWCPDASKIHFIASKILGINSGIQAVICTPDGKNLRAVGSTEKTSINKILNGLGNLVCRSNIAFSPDGKKISYEYSDRKNVNTLYTEDLDGRNVSKIREKAYFLAWCSADTILFTTSEGAIQLSGINGESIRAFIPQEGERYIFSSLSPDKKKIAFRTYGDDISAATGLCHISDLDATNTVSFSGADLEYFDDSAVPKIFGQWRPEHSEMLLCENGNLYILEGIAYDKRLIYSGNASNPQWFPDGKKILFIDKQSLLCSIDFDGTNLLHISEIGINNKFIWKDGRNKISIDPTGTHIAFSSALDQKGKTLKNEPSIDAVKFISAPVFLVNSNGTGLEQITHAKQGRHYFADGWSPDGNLLVISYFQYSGRKHGNKFLYSIDGTDISSGWEKVAISQMIGSGSMAEDGPFVLNETIAQKEKNADDTKQTPGFSLMELFVAMATVHMFGRRRNL